MALAGSRSRDGQAPAFRVAGLPARPPPPPPLPPWHGSGSGPGPGPGPSVQPPGRCRGGSAPRSPPGGGAAQLLAQGGPQVAEKLLQRVQKAIFYFVPVGI